MIDRKESWFGHYWSIHEFWDPTNLIFSYTHLTFQMCTTHYDRGDAWCNNSVYLDDVIQWKHIARYWPFARGIHRSPVNSLHKGQWRGALMFSLICAWIKGWVNNREAGELRIHRAHYDVTAMIASPRDHSALILRKYHINGVDDKDKKVIFHKRNFKYDASSKKHYNIIQLNQFADSENHNPLQLWATTKKIISPDEDCQNVLNNLTWLFQHFKNLYPMTHNMD